MGVKCSKKYDFYQPPNVFDCDLYLYRMQKSSTLRHLLFTSFILIVLSMSFGAAYGQHSIGLDKKGKIKRLHFYAGDHIKIKLIDKEKVSGHIDAIYDSSFIIEGRKIKLTEVGMVYSTRPAMRFIGGALMVSGAFYFAIDAVNNVLNYEARGYVFSNSVWTPSAIAVGTGAILYHFSTRRTKVSGKNNFRIFNTTPIPIARDSSTVNKTQKCDHGLTAKLKILNLDGCKWVIELPDGKRLEPLNILEYIDQEAIGDTTEMNVKVEYYVTKSASICMVGETVAITCLEVLGE